MKYQKPALPPEQMSVGELFDFERHVRMYIQWCDGNEFGLNLKQARLEHAAPYLEELERRKLKHGYGSIVKK